MTKNIHINSFYTGYELIKKIFLAFSFLLIDFLSYRTALHLKNILSIEKENKVHKDYSNSTL